MIISLFFNDAYSSENKLYTIKNIYVTATDKDALTAQKIAIDEGQKQGLFKLLSEMTMSQEYYNNVLPHLKDINISSLVQGYEIRNEIIEDKKYSSYINISFYKDKLNAVLEDLDVNLYDFSNGQILVIPLLKKNNEYYLWEDNNIWKKEWENYPVYHNVTILPLGDLDDISNITTEAAMSGDFTILKYLKDKYNSSDIVVAETEITNDNGDISITLKIQPIGESNIPLFEEKKLYIEGEFEESEFISWTVNTANSYIEEYFKQQEKQKLLYKSVDVSVRFNSLGGWNKIRSTLNRAKLKNGYRLKELSSGNAVIELYYQGDFTLFKGHLYSKGLDLLGEEDDLYLLSLK